MIWQYQMSDGLNVEAEYQEDTQSESDSSCDSLRNCSSDMTDSEILDILIATESTEQQNNQSFSECTINSSLDTCPTQPKSIRLHANSSDKYDGSLFDNQLPPVSLPNHDVASIHQKLGAEIYQECNGKSILRVEKQEENNRQQVSPDSQHSYYAGVNSQNLQYENEDNYRRLDYEDDSESGLDASFVSSTTSPKQTVNKRDDSGLSDNYFVCSERWEPGEIVDNRMQYDTVHRHGRSNDYKRNLQDVYLVEEPANADEGEGTDILGTDRSNTNCGSLTKKRSHLTIKTGKKRGPRPKLLTKNEKKQKRLDANDRERQRMGQLNTAFNLLRNLLPKHPGCPDRELSKFETVQIAKNYIKALNDMLIEAQSYGEYASLDVAAERALY